MNPTTEQQVRLNIALNYKGFETDQSIEAKVAQLEAIYQWVMGPKATILPVSKFEIVKQ